MYKTLTKNGQLFALILGVGCAAIALLSIIFGLSGAGYSVSDDLNSIMKSNPEATFNFFNPAITIVILLVILAMLAWLIFAILRLVSDPKGSIKFFISFGAILLIVFILYSISENETTGKIHELLQKNNIGEGTSKLISAGLKTTVLLAVLSVVAMVGMEIRNAFK